MTREYPLSGIKAIHVVAPQYQVKTEYIKSKQSKEGEMLKGKKTK